MDSNEVITEDINDDLSYGSYKKFFVALLIVSFLAALFHFREKILGKIYFWRQDRPDDLDALVETNTR